LFVIGLQDTSKLKSLKDVSYLNECIRASIPSHVILLLYKDISKNNNLFKFVKHPASCRAPTTVRELLKFIMILPSQIELQLLNVIKLYEFLHKMFHIIVSHPL
jgi:hypothetical protein